MRISIFLILLMLLGANSICQAQFGFFLRDNEKRVDIPFEIHSNLIVVPLVLNNRIPLKFVLDTGVRNAILTEKDYTDILAVPYDRMYTIRGAGGQKLVDAYVANNITLTLPGVKGTGHAMLVLAKDYIELRNFLGSEVHGMLGYELFSRFIVKIDYRKKILSLINPKDFKIPKGYLALDMTIKDTKPYLSIPINFEDGSRIIAKILVDTGASHGLILDPESGDSIHIPKKTLDAHIGRGLAGKIEGRVGRVSSLEFGDMILNSPLTSFPYPESYMDSLNAAAEFRNGTLGGDIVRRFTVIFDYGNEKLYLKKNSSFKKPFYYNMSGITIKALGAKLNEFEIDEVREYSDAYKVGLRAGDRVVQVNGINTINMTLSILNGYFNARPGKLVKLMVMRKGEQMRFSFRLSSPI